MIVTYINCAFVVFEKNEFIHLFVQCIDLKACVYLIGTEVMNIYRLIFSAWLIQTKFQKHWTNHRHQSTSGDTVAEWLRCWLLSRLWLNRNRPRFESRSGHYSAIRLDRLSQGLPGLHPSKQGRTLGTRPSWTSRLGLGVWVLRVRV